MTRYETIALILMWVIAMGQTWWHIRNADKEKWYWRDRAEKAEEDLKRLQRGEPTQAQVNAFVKESLDALWTGGPMPTERKKP